MALQLLEALRQIGDAAQGVTFVSPQMNMAHPTPPIDARPDLAGCILSFYYADGASLFHRHDEHEEPLSLLPACLLHRPCCQ